MSPVPFLHTPAGNFTHLQDFPYFSQFIEIDGMQMHYIDEGPREAPVMLLMHGMPTWGYLYRHMIPLLVEA
jgi:haloalkane dehalogenase